MPYPPDGINEWLALPAPPSPPSLRPVIVIVCISVVVVVPVVTKLVIVAVIRITVAGSVLYREDEEVARSTFSPWRTRNRSDFSCLKQRKISHPTPR